MVDRDEFNDDWDDDDDADADEYGAEREEQEESTLPCPYCGEEIYEDAQRCPHCGQYVSTEDRPVARQPWWIIIAALAVMYAVYRWTVG
jgi:hypothetical protein